MTGDKYDLKRYIIRTFQDTNESFNRIYHTEGTYNELRPRFSNVSRYFELLSYILCTMEASEDEIFSILTHLIYEAYEDDNNTDRMNDDIKTNI